MRQKIAQHDTEPDNDLQEYIPYSEIHDEDTDEEPNFVAIFAIIGWCGMDPKDTQTQEWLPNESYDSLWSNRKN